MSPQAQECPIKLTFDPTFNETILNIQFYKTGDYLTYLQGVKKDQMYSIQFVAG